LRTLSAAEAHPRRNKVIGDMYRERPNNKSPIDFESVSSELERLHLMREKVIAEAFDTLEITHTLLAQMLLMHVGDRRKAARWMCARQRFFDGKIGYDLIAEGDSEKVWDEIERSN
jgi:hypothetical protein